MRIRDTAFTNRAREETGRWIRRLREAKGLSQMELAKTLNEPHYSFVSQLETGRRSVPSFLIRQLACALDVPLSVFAKSLLQHQDPFTFAAIFEDAQAFDRCVNDLVSEVAEPPRPGLRSAILRLLESAPAGLSVRELRTRLQDEIGRELHFQSVSQALRKLSSEGVTVKVEKNWRLI